MQTCAVPSCTRYAYSHSPQPRLHRLAGRLVCLSICLSVCIYAASMHACKQPSNSKHGQPTSRRCCGCSSAVVQRDSLINPGTRGSPGTGQGRDGAEGRKRSAIAERHAQVRGASATGSTQGRLNSSLLRWDVGLGVILCPTRASPSRLQGWFLPGSHRLAP